MSWWRRALGIRADEDIEADVEAEAPVRAARRQLARADNILERLQIPEDRMIADLQRAEEQRQARRRIRQ